MLCSYKDIVFSYKRNDCPFMHILRSCKHSDRPYKNNDYP